MSCGKKTKQASCGKYDQGGRSGVVQTAKEEQLSTTFKPELYHVREWKGQSIILEKHGVKSMQHVSCQEMDPNRDAGRD